MRSWGCLAEWGSSHESECEVWQSCGVTVGSTCAGWPGLCSPLAPLPGVTVVSHASKLRCAVGEIAATVGHWNGWFKFPGDPSFYFLVWIQFWKIQSSWISAGSLIQEKCQEIKLSAACERVKVLENAPKQSWELGIILKCFICVLKPISIY